VCTRCEVCVLNRKIACVLSSIQKLKAENDILRSVLRGSIVFLANDNKEKVQFDSCTVSACSNVCILYPALQVYGAVTGSGIVPPALKTVRNIPNGQVV
jgi:hypothetical protein